MPTPEPEPEQEAESEVEAEAEPQPGHSLVTGWAAARAAGEVGPKTEGFCFLA